MHGGKNNGNTYESELAMGWFLLKLDHKYKGFMILLSLLVYVLEIFYIEWGEMPGEA